MIYAFLGSSLFQFKDLHVDFAGIFLGVAGKMKDFKQMSIVHK